MPQRSGTAHYKARLTPELVRTLRAEHFAYVTGYATLGRRYGLPWATVRDVVTYRTWRHVV